MLQALDVVVGIIQVVDMDETDGTYVNYEYAGNHDHDDVTDDGNHHMIAIVRINRNLWESIDVLIFV